MEIRFYLPFGAFAPRSSRASAREPVDPPDPERARTQARQRLSGRLSPRLMKDVGLGDD